MKIEISTMDVQVPWPNGQGSDVMTVQVAKPAGQDGPFGFGKTDAEAVIALLNNSQAR